MESTEALMFVCWLFGSLLGTRCDNIELQQPECRYSSTGFSQNNTILVRGVARVQDYSNASIQILINTHASLNASLYCVMRLDDSNATATVGDCSLHVSEGNNVVTFTITLPSSPGVCLGKIAARLINDKEHKDSNELDLSGVCETNQITADMLINGQNVSHGGYLKVNTDTLSIRAICQSPLSPCKLHLSFNDRTQIQEAESILQYEVTYPMPKSTSITLAVYVCNNNQPSQKYTYNVAVDFTKDKAGSIVVVVICCILGPIIYPMSLVVIYLIRNALF
ncbi:uncharacterized protein LOC106066224 isoform X2 [Biomphalaria glabrata]|uniref:Uncharacterized protein LOC106066224 isoform X2 n=1 Tax=Biomphalaria glabrata TaxID=6526 RepID=A0A9W2YUC7_BIOGL|nr:uncharacterized protein LOC106066224 isoform X2 [Biomphalaria glabrata]